MNRRLLLETAAVGLTAGLAGCATFEGPFDEESTEEVESDDTATDNPQADDSSTDTDMSNDNAADETDAIDSDRVAGDQTDTIDSDRVAGATFTHTGECSDPETASIEVLYSDVEAIIAGCIEGRNGCAVPVVLGGSDDDGTLRIEIGEVDASDDDMMCTQAIVQLGYELRVRFDGELPETIEVFHDGAVQQAVVATASP